MRGLTGFLGEWPIDPYTDINAVCDLIKAKNILLRAPGIEPEAGPWEDPMLPLHHTRLRGAHSVASRT